MQFVDQTLRQFLTAAASPRPTPGGGAVAALTGALACTMAEMAANFTLGKKKFASVQQQVQDLRDQTSALRSRLVAQMDADAESFLKLQMAQHLPKGTQAELVERQRQIDAASLEASGVPSGVADICVEVLEKAAAIAEICNPKLLSDVGVCGHLAYGALQAAHLNVIVNLRGSMDADLTERENGRIAQRNTRAEELLAAVEKTLKERGAVGSPAETGFFELPPID
jgi:formiminotetrahydrofolate cyclodeaminase